MACTPKYGQMHLKPSHLLHSCYNYRQSYPRRMNLPSMLQFTIIIMHILFPTFQLDVQLITTPLMRSNFALRRVPDILATLLLTTVMSLLYVWFAWYALYCWRLRTASRIRVRNAVFRRVCRTAKSDDHLRHPSVRLSTRMEQLGSHWMDFSRNVIFEDF